MHISPLDKTNRPMGGLYLPSITQNRVFPAILKIVVKKLDSNLRS